MKDLFKVLPPFAPDYSGVCSVLFELGGIVVVHDAGGCTGNVTGYDEPRWYGNSSAIYSSELREIDAVTGDDEKFLIKLEDAISVLERNFVALLGSPAPMVIGTHFKALAHILTKKTGLPVLAFDTNGINYYDSGSSMAFLELARAFVKPAMDRACNKVNIIGATPLDIGKQQNIEKLIFILNTAGYEVISCWGMGSTLETIAGSAEAGANIVVSRSGMDAARYMEKEYGIPFIARLPIGNKTTERFVSDLDSLMSGSKRTAILQDESLLKRQEKVLVIGEQLRANAIRDCCKLDMGMTEVDVASFFTMDKLLIEESDICLEQENDLRSLTDEKQYDFIVGDPLYEELLAEDSKSRFIAFPHVALSSRLYWDDDFVYVGRNGFDFLQKEMKLQDFQRRLKSSFGEQEKFFCLPMFKRKKLGSINKRKL
ncbi:MAG: nitrogenase component 1 [Bacillota bacterium]|nr:nitrogenase component 1 [Bacillota bacterium]